MNKMKTLLRLIPGILLFLAFNSTAQKRVALHSNGVTTIFSSTNPYIDAYNASIAGDTIYLSGGTFNSPSNIDKGITVFGAGFHVDSTTATFQTVIAMAFSIGENADGLHLEGLKFQYTVNVITNYSFNNAHISRCYFSGSFNASGSNVNLTEYLVVSECVFTSPLNVQNIQNSLFTNNIFQSQISYSTNNSFRNNVFLREGRSSSSASGKVIYYSSNNVFEDNVFYNSLIYVIEGSGNTFQRNLFSVTSPQLGTTPITVDNYYGVPQASIFVNQAGFTWLTTNDNHLQDPVTYFGTDGNEVGIYGGLFPFKPGAVPQNPHFISKTIAPSTDSNGDLNIQIQVGAQDE
jgi:hypothetical protein